MEKRRLESAECRFWRADSDMLIRAVAAVSGAATLECHNITHNITMTYAPSMRWRSQLDVAIFAGQGTRSVDACKDSERTLVSERGEA